MEKVSKDIEKALNLTSKPTYASGRIFKFTNEFLKGYVDYFENKKTMLGVIGSGDQIFTAISLGTEDVEAFDINPLVKYYFYLKKAGIEVLTREEFIDMFLDLKMERKEIYAHYLNRIFAYLNQDTKLFWISLLEKYDWFNLYKTRLFSSDCGYIQSIKATVPYLEINKYQNLQKRMKNVSIEIKDGNILELADSYSQKSFDLIYLSNIWAYLPRAKNEYHKVEQKLKLTPNGCLVAYSFGSPYIVDKSIYETRNLIDYEYSIVKKGS